MPVYEYRCAECHEKFEKLVRSSQSEGEVACPSCGSELVKRLVSLFGSLGLSTSSSGGNCAPRVGGG
ncbi:MAG: zinc ribbon domain-containing protein [Chloroflexi bacterium]|nr:zinc ribbon domain-containing protein [Chloroflexota bacterium]